MQEGFKTWTCCCYILLATPPDNWKLKIPKRRSSSSSHLFFIDFLSHQFVDTLRAMADVIYSTKTARVGQYHRVIRDSKDTYGT